MIQAPDYLTKNQNRWRRFFRKHHMTQPVLAELTNIDERRLSALLSGWIKPNTIERAQIEAVLDKVYNAVHQEKKRRGRGPKRPFPVNA